jgi:hypothetical protein
VHMGWPELHRRDHKQSDDRLSTHGSNEAKMSCCDRGGRSKSDESVEVMKNKIVGGSQSARSIG